MEAQKPEPFGDNPTVLDPSGNGGDADRTIAIHDG
jgi:hypothetical protein